MPELLASELEALQPADVLALIGDNLRLPDQTDGHNAHGHDADRKDQAHLRFGRLAMESSSDPGHELGLLVLGRYAGPMRNMPASALRSLHQLDAQLLGQFAAYSDQEHVNRMSHLQAARPASSERLRAKRARIRPRRPR